MVVGKPYIHFKVNNEPIEEVVDYNYTWATTVEAQKGPINTPTYISSAAQAQSIFGIDMRPFFAQGPRSLIMVRVAASSDTNTPRKGKYVFKTKSDIVIYRAEQLVITSEKYPKTGRKHGDKSFVLQKDENGQDIPGVHEHKTVRYEHKMFYAIDKEGQYVAVIPKRDSEGILIPDIYIDTWTADGRIITEEDVAAAAAKPEFNESNLITGDGKDEGQYDPEDYKQNLTASTEYTVNEVSAFYIPEEYPIAANTPLFEVESEFEGVYDVSITCGADPSDMTGGNGYRIVISQGGRNSLIIRNALNVQKIVNRINDSDLDVVAKTTIAGDMITMAMQAYPTSIKTQEVDVKVADGTEAKTQTLIISSITNNTFIGLAKTPTYSFVSYSDAQGSNKIGEGKVVVQAQNRTSNKVKVIENNVDGFVGKSYYVAGDADISDNALYQLYEDDQLTNATGMYVKISDADDVATYLTDDILESIQNYENKVTSQPPIQYAADYAINLKAAGEQSLMGASRGPWDDATSRITQQYQAQAHKAGLDTLRRIRLAGIFCMYGEEAIQYEYLQHGMNDLEPEKGMNNNETCKWRTILLGANAENRSDISSLINKAKNLNNQYVLFLGHGLIDTGMTGIVATLSNTEKQNLIHAKSDNQLLPYECTQYIAGLRSKLDYGESIFGGQGRKRIRGVGDLDIAPLTSYDDEYVWDPNNYTKLNEGGVLTFTEDYGNITLTDGVTTIQRSNEEDEEGVMNILKYAQNAIYDVCLPYIGRNIDVDLENSITTAIEKVLETMKTTDQTLIDTDAYPAYDVTVTLGSRRNQLLGRIYVYCVICPVHAVRQIEVEMTVQ